MTHLKTMSKPFCGSKAKKMKLTILRNDVTCPKCKAECQREWDELVRNHPER